jgi:hypothetical protein
LAANKEVDMYTNRIDTCGKPIGEMDSGSNPASVLEEFEELWEKNSKEDDEGKGYAKWGYLQGRREGQEESEKLQSELKDQCVITCRVESDRAKLQERVKKLEDELRVSSPYVQEILKSLQQAEDKVKENKKGGT